MVTCSWLMAQRKTPYTQIRLSLKCSKNITITLSALVVCVLGWYLLRPRWVPCWSALAALVAGGVV